MPEHLVPDPEDLDRAPQIPESLRAPNDEFIDDLEAKMDRPLTWQERLAQQQAARDRERIARDNRPKKFESVDDTLEKLNALMTTEVAKAQWAKLDQDSKDLFQAIRILYQNIGKQAINKSGDDELVQLMTVARSTWDELGTAHEVFINGQANPLEFIDALNKALKKLSAIEERLSTHK